MDVNEENADADISRKIMCDEEKIYDFQSLLLDNSEYIQNLTLQTSSEPVDDMVKQFTQYLHDAFEVFGKAYSQ